MDRRPTAWYGFGSHWATIRISVTRFTTNLIPIHAMMDFQIPLSTLLKHVYKKDTIPAQLSIAAVTASSVRIQPRTLIS